MTSLFNYEIQSPLAEWPVGLERGCWPAMWWTCSFLSCSSLPSWQALGEQSVYTESTSRRNWRGILKSDASLSSHQKYTPIETRLNMHIWTLQKCFTYSLNLNQISLRENVWNYKPEIQSVCCYHLCARVEIILNHLKCLCMVVITSLA